MADMGNIPVRYFVVPEEICQYFEWSNVMPIEPFNGKCIRPGEGEKQRL